MAPKRIRMRRGVVYQTASDKWARAIAAGAVLAVPQDIDAETALAWLKAGLAIEDKLGPGPAETK
jgi:hypothetical protein